MPSLTLPQQTDLAPELAEQLHDDVAELFASAQCLACEDSADYRADDFHPVQVFDAEGEERAYPPAVAMDDPTIDLSLEDLGLLLAALDV